MKLFNFLRDYVIINSVLSQVSRRNKLSWQIIYCLRSLLDALIVSFCSVVSAALLFLSYSLHLAASASSDGSAALLALFFLSFHNAHLCSSLSAVYKSSVTTHAAQN